MSRKEKLAAVSKCINKCVHKDGRIPKPSEVAKTLELPETSVRRYFKELGFITDSNGHVKWSKELEENLSRNMVQVYTYMHKYCALNLIYPSTKDIAETLGVSTSTVRKCIRALKVLGLVDTSLFKSSLLLDDDCKEIVYRAILKGFLEMKCCPSFREIQHISKLSMHRVKKAVDSLVADNKIIRNGDKRRSISVVEFTEGEEITFVGSGDIEARLLNAYMALIRETMDAYFIAKGEEPERSVLQKLSGLTQEVFDKVTEKMGLYKEGCVYAN